MLVLLEECLPTVLRHELRGRDVRSVRYMGWSGLENGELLSRMAEHGYEVILTGDRNLRFQQNLHEAGIGVIELAQSS